VALLAVGLGAILCIAGILRITMRPAANPLFGRRMIVRGLLLVAAAFLACAAAAGIPA
jgi:uncharacterized membrane protein HdeD (DUF308 family)